MAGEAMENIIINFTRLCAVTLFVFTQHELKSMVKNCPYTINENQQKVIKENRENLLKTIGTQVDLIGTNSQKPYDLRCADLTGIDLSARMLKYIDLSGAQLNNADLSNIRFENVNLSNASLKNSRLIRAHFWDSTLDGADLSNANLPGSQFFGATSILSAVKANFSNANISSGAQLKNVDAREALFNDTDLYFSELISVIVNAQTSFKKTDIRLGFIEKMKGAPDNLKQWLLNQDARIEGLTIDGADADVSMRV